MSQLNKQAPCLLAVVNAFFQLASASIGPLDCALLRVSGISLPAMGIFKDCFGLIPKKKKTLLYNRSFHLILPFLQSLH